MFMWLAKIQKYFCPGTKILSLAIALKPQNYSWRVLCLFDSHFYDLDKDITKITSWNLVLEWMLFICVWMLGGKPKIYSDSTRRKSYSACLLLSLGIIRVWSWPGSLVCKSVILDSASTILPSSLPSLSGYLEIDALNFCLSPRFN